MRKFMLMAGLALEFNAMAAPITFDADPAGQPPLGWSCGATGKGVPKWTVEPDVLSGKGRVLVQSGEAPFPWCIKNDAVLIDGFVEVRFRSIAGRQDQAGGVVWRFKDRDNYYVARANALENNVSLYHTTAGSRRTIAYQDAPVPPKVWHTLRVDFKGPSIRVSLNGKVCIEGQDTNIAGPGQVGVWTKADSVTAFTEFSYGASP